VFHTIQTKKRKHTHTLSTTTTTCLQSNQTSAELEMKRQSNSHERDNVLAGWSYHTLQVVIDGHGMVISW
jgi:hypothetical protein